MHNTANAARPAVTVVVCTRGRGDLVKRCVASVVPALASSDELIVVEAETHAARDLVDGLNDPRCRWLFAALPGRSRQLNHGIRAARGEVILVTDDDCVVAPGWVDAMASAFVEEDVGMAFGAVDGLTRTSGDIPARRLAPGPAPREMWAFSHGAAMGVLRAAALEAGGFDERLGPGAAVHGEEADMLLRTQATGWRCWVADAPPVQHLPWRSESEDEQNLLVYERGGGAWVGAALRRDPLPSAGAIWTRLRYQAGHFSTSASAGFALRAQASFGSGLLAGLRLAPRRFIDPRAEQHGGQRSRSTGPPDAASGNCDPVMRRLPWPAVHGRRCLVVSADEVFAAELRRRGASEVVQIDFGQLDRLVGERPDSFDVVVADGVLGLGESAAGMARLSFLCRSHLVSVERIDVPTSILARHRPHVRRFHRGNRSGWLINGAAHRHMLESAGLEVQLASSPWFVRSRARFGFRPAVQRALLMRPAPEC